MKIIIVCFVYTSFKITLPYVLVKHRSTQYLLILYPTTHYQPLVLILTITLSHPPPLSQTLAVGKPPPTPGLIMDYIERHLLNQGRTVTTTTVNVGNSGSGGSGNGSTSVIGSGASAGIASAARKQELAIEALTLAYTVSPTFTPTASQVLLAQQYKQALNTMHDKVTQTLPFLTHYLYSPSLSITHPLIHPPTHPHYVHHA